MTKANPRAAEEEGVVDATVIDEPTDATLRELATRQATGRLAVTPQVEAGELVARLDVIREAMNTAMIDGVDYGRIPGVDKPTLLKPGAEKLGVLFQLDVQLDNAKEWGPGDHLTVNSKATVFHAPTGSRVGYGEGLCTTRERKYAKRKQERTCPTCGAAAVIKGKAEYGGGWLCWKKRDGCGAKFCEGDPAIESQEVGEIDNPDLPDLWNTIIKMAEKRARVDAILAVTGASALFTQDAEDAAPADDPAPTSPPAAEPRRSRADVETTGKSDVTPEWITSDQYTALKAQFAAQGNPVKPVEAWLAEHAPSAIGQSLPARISSLTHEQANGLMAFLTGGKS